MNGTFIATLLGVRKWYLHNKERALMLTCLDMKDWVNYRGITLLGVVRKMFCPNDRLLYHLDEDQRLHEGQVCRVLLMPDAC